MLHRIKASYSFNTALVIIFGRGRLHANGAFQVPALSATSAHLPNAETLLQFMQAASHRTHPPTPHGGLDGGLRTIKCRLITSPP